MLTLYLDGEFKTLENTSWFNNATQCICLLAAYLQKLDITVVVVQKNTSIQSRHFTFADQPLSGFKLPINCFNEVVLNSHECIFKSVTNCCLPAILLESEQFVVSGLCHILRLLVKESNTSLHLLGHKKFCLKAASEISSRTYLCEVIGPNVIDDWSRFGNDITFEIPQALSEFENLLNEPVTIHNRDKRQRAVLKQLTEATMTSDLQDLTEPVEKMAKLYRTNLNAKLAVQTNDLPSLQHVFAEGVEFTLTDLALLPLVHSFINCSIQNGNILRTELSSTMLWYKRVSAIPGVLDAAQLADVNFVSFAEDKSVNLFESSLPTGKCEILKLGNTDISKEGKLKKKELEKTIRRDLPAILNKTNAIPTISFLQFEADDICLSWNSFPGETHPAEGELSSKRASRKCHQIENVFHGVKSMCKDGDLIIDFCAGGGHVGIVIAYLLPRCKVVILDNKEESLDRARRRIKLLKLNNIQIYQCNLQNYIGSFDVGVALHACGVATDLVLQKCLDAKASFVISPCCYGKIQCTETITYPQSKHYRSAEIDYESLVLLGHAADQTSWDFEGEKPKQGKRCMELVDTDRAFYAQELGYETSLYTMQPHDCSPKNNLLVGVSPASRSDTELTTVRS